MSGFYKMDPAAWDFGTASLTLEQEAAYLRIVNAIHKHDAPVPNNDRVLAGLFRSSTRKARSLLDALVAAGKLVIEDGCIWNERARSDMVQRQFVSGSASIRGSKGGRTRAENAAKALKGKDTAQAIASSRIEENRIEKEETPNGVSKKPAEDLKVENPPSVKSNRGTRLPDDWVLTKSLGDWAVDQGLTSFEVRQQAEIFKNHWLSTAGAKALKARWDLTWKNWIHRYRDEKKKGRPVYGQPSQVTDLASVKRRIASLAAFRSVESGGDDDRDSHHADPDAGF